MVASGFALLALGLALAHAPVAGSLDDAFVVLSDARATFQGVEPGLGAPDAQGFLGGARVEGSTSLLDWAIKGIGLELAPAMDPLRLAGWLGLGWWIAAVLIAVRAAVRWTGSAIVAAAVGGLVAWSPGLAESAGYLLEGPLFALLWILALVAAVEARPALCLTWSLLLAAARPEGLALAPILVGWAGGRQSLAAGVPFGTGGVRWAAAWRWAGAGVLAGALITAVRFWLYGDWLPNTFHAKSSSSRWSEVADGARYLLQVLRSDAGLSAAAVGLSSAVLAVLWLTRHPEAEPRARHSTRSAARGLLAMAALYALGVLVSGGDSYMGARLFMPIGLPVWLALGLAVAGQTLRRSLAALALPLVACFASAVGGSLDARRPWQVFPDAVQALAAGPVGLEAFEGDEEVFRAIAAALAPDEVFAHLHTQRFRWFEPATPVLDLTGLTDREVARRPASGPVRFGRTAIELALTRKVGALHLDPLRGRVTSLVDAPDLAAALSNPAMAPRYFGEPYLRAELAEALSQHYLAASRRLPKGAGYFNLLVRRDLAEAFRAQGFRVARG
ncbi:hypothetical protein [Planctomycetes bacterium Poly30]|uniref:hypothetical protein n=1 Tax=Saltatorellus ferox TaxID=2528018 RepID=UPI0011A07AA8